MKYLVVAALMATVSALPRLHRAVLGGGKIIGGEDATQGQFPYMLSLEWRGSHICGASLIGPKLVITAAHCVEGDEPDILQVVAGEINRWQVSGREQKLNVSRIVVHENYDRPTIFSNDIALLFLSEEAVLNEDVGTIPVPPQEAQTTGNIRVSGFGTTQSADEIGYLKWVDIPVVSDADCQRSYSGETIQPHMLCAGLTEGGKDSCQGDSGGPLVSVTEGSPTLNHIVGIVSWGYGCAAPGYPRVNTEVSYFNDWIQEQILKYKELLL